jgi:hypothetical protein
MFKRGPGPLVSILFPTRGRPEMLAASVKSLLDMATDKSRIEILYKVDFDDAPSIKAVQELAGLVATKVIVSPRGRGYEGLHEYINELSKIASGDWLFIWNDDALMLTNGWDQSIHEASPSPGMGFLGNEDICLMAPRVVQRDISWEFPILRRKVVEILGHFSNSYSSDSYIYWVMSRLRAAVFLEGVVVTHVQNEIDDVTKREGRDASNEYMKKVLNSPGMRALQEEDRKTLEKHIRGVQ